MVKKNKKQDLDEDPDVAKYQAMIKGIDDENIKNR